MQDAVLGAGVMQMDKFSGEQCGAGGWRSIQEINAQGPDHRGGAGLKPRFRAVNEGMPPAVDRRRQQIRRREPVARLAPDRRLAGGRSSAPPHPARRGRVAESGDRAIQDLGRGRG